MTDEQIVKALECCKSQECGECTRLYNSFPDSHECKVDLMEKIFNLIDRQKAEIERLKNENFGLGVERDAAMECMDTAVTEAKSEAIREYVTKYKDYIKNFTGCFNPSIGFTVNLDSVLNAADFVADEMVGDSDA